MELAEFNRAIENIFRITLSSSNRITMSYRFEEQGQEFKLKLKKFKDAVSFLHQLNQLESSELSNENYYEVSISHNGRIFYGQDDITKADTVNKISYKLSSPSDAYLIFIIQHLYTITDLRDIGRFMLFHRLRNRRILEGANGDLFEVLKSIMRIKTLQINSEVKKNKEEFETVSYGFLFNFSYNTDLAFLPSSVLEILDRRIRIGRLRRAKLEDIEPPKRRYENDLILYYQKGISSESVDLQYLSFYHIMEHFFEKIYNDEMIKSIKGELMKPSFSYKRNKDVIDLIKIVQQKLKYRNEEFQINEPEALRLVLEKFIIDFNEIKSELIEYDPKLVNFYKENEVSFSKGNKLNFDESRDTVLKNLRDRIYKTRNSIVHSKETDKEKYLPFKHDKILRQEIMLMRVIAEKIVVGSSKEL